MDRLRKIFEEYGRWADFSIYIERIEGHISSDFSHAIENAKALLESIGKEICNQQGLELESTASINVVLKKAFMAIGFSNDSLIAQVSSALATIGQQIGDLRNDVGATSHGRSIEELKDRNSKIDELTKEFLIDTTVVVATFLIRNFENNNPRTSQNFEETKFLYIDNEEFNAFWDDLYGEFVMGEYSYPASEILFHVDYQAYVNELKDFSGEE